jgi:hypothetical protein
MPSVKTAEKRYVARRIDRDGKVHQSHCIVAMDDEDAIYLAWTISAGLSVELWEGDRLVRTTAPD